MRRLAPFAAVVLACAGAMEAPQAVTVGNDVTVAITPPPDVLPFNPRAARIQGATQRLSAEAGHPIAVQIDQALVPPSRSGFEEDLAASLENVAAGLEDLKRSRPAAFAREAPKLARIEVRYDAAALRPDAEFAPERGALVVTWPPSASGALVRQGFVSGALDDAFDRELERTYAEASPERLDRARWTEFFEWATGPHPRAPAPAGGDRLANDPRAAAALRVAALSRVVGGSDPALAKRIDAYLADFGRLLADLYHDGGDELRGAPAGSPLRRAEAAWGAWATARADTLDPAAKLRVGEAVFHGGYIDRDYLGRPHGEKSVRGRDRFGGFDAFSFGLKVIDAWIAAGHPATGDEKDASFELMRVVVCPWARDARGKLDSNRGCEHGFLRQALDDDALARRLADELAKRGDGALLESMIANAAHTSDGGHATSALLAALAPHAREWRAMMIQLVEELARDHSGLLKAEAQRVWAASPDRRGTALYVLARLDRSFDPHYTNSWWADFPKRYGGPVGAELFSSMLDQSPRAMQVVGLMWPALEPRFSRAAPIAAHLDRFLDEPMIRDDDSGDPGRTLRAIIARVCEDGRPGELAKLHAQLAARAAKSPGGALDNFVLDTAPGRCPRPKPDAPSSSR